MVASRGPDNHSWQRPADLLGGAPLPHDRSPQAGVLADGAPPRVCLDPAPGAAQSGAAGRLLQRAGAAQARCPGPARHTGQSRAVAAASDAHEHRPGVERSAHQLRRRGGNARGAAGGVAAGGGVGVGGPHSRTHRAALPRSHREVEAPPRRHRCLRIGGASSAGEQQRSAGIVRTQHQHLPRMRVRGPRLAEEVVPVVPHRQQPDVVHRGERGGAGPDGDPDLPTRKGEERAVAGLWAERRGQHHVPPRPESGAQRSIQPGDVPRVGEAHDCPSSGGQRRDHCADEQLHPVRASYDIHHRARGRTLAERPEHGDAAVVGLPEGRVDVRDGHDVRHSGRRLLLAGMTGRHREAHDVCERPCVAVRDRPAQPDDVRTQDHLRRHRLLNPSQTTLVRGTLRTVQHEAVDLAPRESDPHP
jgi:hypothetical protein